MLATLSVRDVVLVDRLDLSFLPGLSALTGETGAGKSILLDALGLVLGSRGDARLIRHGCEQASVSACFRLDPGHPAHGVLRESGIGLDHDLVVRRVVGKDGRSRAFVNDQPVSVALLRSLGETLVEIHGQFESQRLLEPVFHRSLLDAFGGLTALSEATAESFRAWQVAAGTHARAVATAAEAQRDQDYARHALEELSALDPRPGEESELAERRTLLQNAEKILGALNDAAAQLRGGGGGRGIADALNAARRTIDRLDSKAGHGSPELIVALDRALGEVLEAESLLAKAIDEVDRDPGQLERVEERLFNLRRLARKHGVAVDGLIAVRAELDARLAAADEADRDVAKLKDEERQARARFEDQAGRLSAARAEAARRLEAAVAAELEPLRLGKARFVARVTDLPETEWGAHGRDRVEFEVATNPGIPPGPLARVASGGELARFMLALKVALARADPVPTLVFDEVDSGVGGAVAAAVGERLARLAHTFQVLVVTHSPQVAARGHHHRRVAKATRDSQARTSVEVLDAGGRREEIARMLAGARITDEARAAADSLLTGSAA